MSENEIITMYDEDGNGIEFEIIASLIINENEYRAAIATDTDNNADFFEYHVFKVTEEDGEEYFVSVDDDNEFDMVIAEFDKLFEAEME